MILLSEPPLSGPAAAAARPPFGTVAPSAEIPASPVPPPPDLPAMRARFLVDFTGGRMGQQHNTVQHRERVLRQLAQARPGG